MEKILFLVLYYLGNSNLFPQKDDAKAMFNLQSHVSIKSNFCFW